MGKAEFFCVAVSLNDSDPGWKGPVDVPSPVLAQSWVSPKFRPGCSGLWPLGS